MSDKSDLIMWGVIGVGGYLLLKDSFKGISNTTEGVGSNITQATGSVANAVDNILSPTKIISTVTDKIDTAINNVGKSSTPIITNVSSGSNNNAKALFSAQISGATYNTTSGILKTSDGKGYSVAPSNVPNMLKQINTTTQSVNIVKQVQSLPSNRLVSSVFKK